MRRLLLTVQPIFRANVLRKAVSPFGNSSVNVSSGFAGIADVIIIFIIKLSGAKIVKIPQTNSFSYGKLTYCYEKRRDCFNIASPPLRFLSSQWFRKSVTSAPPCHNRALYDSVRRVGPSRLQEAPVDDGLRPEGDVVGVALVELAVGHAE